MSLSSRRRSFVALSALAIAATGVPATAAPANATATATIGQRVAAATTSPREATGWESSPVLAVPNGKVRILDTRAPGNTALAPGATVRGCRAWWSPASPDGGRMLVNVTVTAPVRGGHLEDGGLPATTSLVNFDAGRTVANMALLTAERDESARAVCVSVRNASTAPLHLVLDHLANVAGRRVSGMPGLGAIDPGAPRRLLDTRRTQRPVPANGYLDVPVTSDTRYGGDLVNVTAVTPSRPGWAAITPGGAARPVASTLSFATGHTQAGLTLTKLSSTGMLRVHNGSTAPLHVVLDLTARVEGGGVPEAAAATIPRAPKRVLDTRTTTVLRPGESRSVSLAPAGMPASASGVVLATTATASSSGGHLSYVAGPAGTASTSVVNHTRGATTTNSSVEPVTSRTVTLRNTSSGTVHVVVDVVGWVTAWRFASGRVLDAAGDGIPGARLVVSPPGPASPVLGTTAADGSYLVPVLWVPTDTGGNDVPFALCALPPVPASGLPSFASSCHRQFPDPRVFGAEVGSRVTSADIVLQRAGVLEGVVTSGGGTPTNAVMMAWSRDGTFAALAGVGGNGGWQLPVPPGDYLVVADTTSSAHGPPMGWAGELATDVPDAVVTSIPLYPASLESITPDLDGAVADGATVHHVSVDAVTDVEPLDLEAAGRVSVSLDSSAVMTALGRAIELRSESGYAAYRLPVPGRDITSASAKVRPGRYVVCFVDAIQEQCWNDTGETGTATVIEVEAGVVREVSLTLQ